MCGEQGNWLLTRLPTYATIFSFLVSVFSLDMMTCTHIYRGTLCSECLLSLEGLPFPEGRTREGNCVEEAGEFWPGEREKTLVTI